MSETMSISCIERDTLLEIQYCIWYQKIQKRDEGPLLA